VWSLNDPCRSLTTQDILWFCNNLGERPFPPLSAGYISVGPIWEIRHQTFPPSSPRGPSGFTRADVISLVGKGLIWCSVTAALHNSTIALWIWISDLSGLSNSVSCVRRICGTSIQPAAQYGPHCLPVPGEDVLFYPKCFFYNSSWKPGESSFWSLFTYLLFAWDSICWHVSMFTEVSVKTFLRSVSKPS